MWRARRRIRALTNIAPPEQAMGHRLVHEYFLSSLPHRLAYNFGAQSRFVSRTGEAPCPRSIIGVCATILRLP